MAELNLIQDKYLEEVQSHHALNSKLSILEKQVKDAQKPSQQLGLDQRQQDLLFFDQMKEKFLGILSLYLEEIRNKNRLINALTANEMSLRDQLIR